MRGNSGARRRGWTCVVGAVSAMTAIGCLRPPMPPPGPVLPFVDAVGVVNENASRIGGVLRAVGAVDCATRLREGRRVSFSLDGVLFFLAPRHVRFDLKRFGDRKLLIGSNETHYWYLDLEHEVRRCSAHGEDIRPEEHAAPIPADQLIDALGLSRIPEGPEARQAGLLQRVDAEYQQVLWTGEAAGGPALSKEYWLDRRPPRLVRRVIFRDTQGAVQMESRLDDYRALSANGPWVPHSMTAYWPATDAKMHFNVSRWTVHTDIGPEGVQFASPPECGSK